MTLRYEYCAPYEGSRLDHVGTYKRTLPVSLERMYENALDWEHLSHLHGSSFKDIQCLEAGGWGWRAQTTDAKGRESELELALDRSCRRWVTRNLAGPSEGAEIWTHVFVTGPRQLDLVIDFFVPGVQEDSRAKVGMAYATAYETLYDEDVWMMTERQRILDQRLDSIQLTEVAKYDVPQAEELPLKVSVSGRDFSLHRWENSWVIVPAACPHQLGPLDGDIDAQGRVHCPWHGYAFDVRSGDCVSGSHCRFGKRPQVIEKAGTLELHWFE